MKSRFVLLVFAHFFIGKMTAKPPVEVFRNGSDGYQCFRIPALVRLPGGEILALAEGRRNGCDDFGDVDIVLKRSADGGKSWSPLEVVVDQKNLQAGNVSPVFDGLDSRFSAGRLLLFYCTGNATEFEIMQGRGVREVWLISSIDGGRNWAAPRNLTASVHRPGVAPYFFKEDWRGFATGPGHALLIENGPKKGRIFVPTNHTEGPIQVNWANNFAAGFFTDDHGETFSIGQSLGISSNEATAAVLADGSILMSCRNQAGQPRCRIHARSRDGGASWDEIFYEKQLDDPVCQASILRIGKRLVFSNPASASRRENLSLHISRDGGQTWRLRKRIFTGPSAYSDLTKMGRRRIGILFEKGNEGGIFFTTARV